jgi:hypothetical protein
MKSKTLIAIIIGVVVLAGIGYGINLATKKVVNKVAENVVENVVEKATNSQVDFDPNNNSIVVNTNGGSFQAGEDVSLPSDFPKDVYVIDGKIKSAISTQTDNGGYSLSIVTTKSPADAYADYDNKIKADGWTVTTTGTFGGVYTVMANKDNRLLSVSMNESDGQTMVILSVYRETSINSNATEPGT